MSEVPQSQPPQSAVEGQGSAFEPPVQAKPEAVTATFDMLVKKPRRVVTQTVTMPDGSGGIMQLKLKFEGLSPTKFDELGAAYPPTGKDKQENRVWDSVRFPIALVAATCIEPKMTYEQVEQLYNHPDWASGEFNDLFVAAMRATNGGLDVPFNGLG